VFDDKTLKETNRFSLMLMKNIRVFVAEKHLKMGFPPSRE
jgi:hypothetical protein